MTQLEPIWSEEVTTHQRGDLEVGLLKFRVPAKSMAAFGNPESFYITVFDEGMANRVVICTKEIPTGKPVSIGRSMIFGPVQLALRAPQMISYTIGRYAKWQPNDTVRVQVFDHDGTKHIEMRKVESANV